MLAQETTSTPNAKLTVILPAFNEEPFVASVIEKTKQTLSQWSQSWEVIVVDDGSTDRTAQIAADASVKILRHDENLGYGASIRDGIKAADGEWIAILDADGSYDPSLLLELLECLPQYDQVNGARNSEQGSLKFLRTPTKWAIRRLAEWVSGRKIPDLNTGFKVFKRNIAMRYLWVLPEGFSCSTSLTLAFLCNGYRVKYIAIPYRKREGKSKFHPVRDTLNYILTIIRMMTFFRPLRIFLPVAFAFGGIAVIKGLFSIFTSESGLHDADVILAVAAVLIFSLGLLADLVVSQKR